VVLADVRRNLTAEVQQRFPPPHFGPRHSTYHLAN
jgi:hypothetical protein